MPAWAEQVGAVDRSLVGVEIGPDWLTAFGAATPAVVGPIPRRSFVFDR